MDAQTATPTPTPPPRHALIYVNPTFGADPELFFTKEGEIVGSEEVLGDAKTVNANSYNLVKVDGVQAELHPNPSTCRQSFSSSLYDAMYALRTRLQAMPGFSVNFRTTVDIPPATFSKLSEDAKKLGCAPSLNVYDKDAQVSVDGTTYTKRSAGGHIHLGLKGYLDKKALERLVPVLDILVGALCVLIDRDEGAAERRKVYGRAGEHRLPQHGLEYRVLSNFWLRHYVLTSFVLGMSRLAATVVYSSYQKPPMDSTTGKPMTPERLLQYGFKEPWNAEGALLSCVDLETARKAINENSVPLALEVWEGVKRFLTDHVDVCSLQYGPMRPDIFKDFEFFFTKIQQEGISYWFPQEPLESWMSNNRTQGWERYVAEVIRPAREKERTTVGKVTESVQDAVAKVKRTLKRKEAA